MKNGVITVILAVVILSCTLMLAGCAPAQGEAEGRWTRIIANDYNVLPVLEWCAMPIEALIPEQGVEYRVEGWLNAQTALITEFKENRSELKTVTLEGKALPVRYDGAGITQAGIIAVKDGLLAYDPEPSASNTVRIIKYDGDSSFSLVQEVALDGQLRFRPGRMAFNPSNTSFACLRVPKEDPGARQIRISDLSTGKISDIDTLPEGFPTSGSILEFSWLDDSSLLVKLSAGEDEGAEVSSWIYK